MSRALIIPSATPKARKGTVLCRLSLLHKSFNKIYTQIRFCAWLYPAWILVVGGENLKQQSQLIIRLKAHLLVKHSTTIANVITSAKFQSVLGRSHQLLWATVRNLVTFKHFSLSPTYAVSGFVVCGTLGTYNLSHNTLELESFGTCLICHK